jgi:DNA-damage-inducible protein J
MPGFYTRSGAADRLFVLPREANDICCSINREEWQLSFICITFAAAKEMDMVSNALVQTRIDPEIKERASAVLETMGLTVSDAVRILLTRTANEGMFPLELVSDSEAHDAWFRTKVLQALADTRDDVDETDVDAHFERRRADALRQRGGDDR